MTYATEAPDAVVLPYLLWQREWNYSVRRPSLNRYPVATHSGFDFYMNLYNYV